MKPQGACNIILVCIVLHNIATRLNVPVCDDFYDAPEPVENQENLPAMPQNRTDRGCNMGFKITFEFVTEIICEK